MPSFCLKFLTPQRSFTASAKVNILFSIPLDYPITNGMKCRSCCCIFRIKFVYQFYPLFLSVLCVSYSFSVIIRDYSLSIRKQNKNNKKRKLPNTSLFSDSFFLMHVFFPPLFLDFCSIHLQVLLWRWDINIFNIRK